MPTSRKLEGDGTIISATSAGREGHRLVPVCAALMFLMGPAVALEPYVIVGDAISRPLGDLAGDPARGNALVRDRERGNCLICHQGVDRAEPFQGTIGPPLVGVGLRLDSGQIRLRLVDASLLNPETVMPPYFRTQNLRDVASQYRDKPALSAQEIEDVVSYLATLRTF